MFNFTSKLSSIDNELMHFDSREFHMIETMIIEQFANMFDCIYTINAYKSRKRNYYIVDVAFELNTNDILFDNENDVYRVIQNFDARLHVRDDEIQIAQYRAYKTCDYDI